MTMGAGAVGVDAVPALIVEFSREPHLKLQRVNSPRFLSRMADTYPFTPATDDFHGCYLTLIASREWVVPEELSNVLAQNPNDDKALNALEQLLSERISNEIRPDAQLAAAIAAVKLAPAVFEPWLEFNAYWGIPSYYSARYASRVTEVLDVQTAPSERIKSVTESILFAAQESQFTRAFQLAGNWYLSGRSEIAGSTERFLGVFQCLEALTNCAPQHPSAELMQWFEVVSDLLAGRDDGSRAALLGSFDLIKQRLARPTLGERFRRLVGLLNLPNQELLIDQFDALNKIRNDLLHAHITTVPGTFRGYNVDVTLTDLSTLLLTAVADRIIGDVKATGVSVRRVPK